MSHFRLNGIGDNVFGAIDADYRMVINGFESKNNAEDAIFHHNNIDSRDKCCTFAVDLIDMA